MNTYFAPIRDMRFVIQELADLRAVAALPDFEEVTPDLVDAVLAEAGKLAAEVLAPLNKSGDQQGARLEGGEVVAAGGFADAYRKFIGGGWNGLGAPVDYGGQGLPDLLGAAVHEIWNSANMAFALCPLLTAGAIEALRRHGTPEQQALYLPKLISGEWSGTMNLTEPQAGSDLAAVRARAVPEGDRYRLYGQKIFITWGEHDMADNIVHMVLARTPDAPEDVKGISLFLVPKYLVNANGSLGARNDVHCVSIEHKLGIHASPTCMLAYGDKDGAIGWLVGEENEGLAHMFTMMNEARLKVGLQGLAIAERAYQQARDYAKERVQGRPVGIRQGRRVNILHHPDVRRMLMSMKARIEAMRALCYVTAMHMDMAKHHPDPETRRFHQARLDLLIPIVKGWCTELGVEIASTGVQVHGGMGYIEETGACQHLRDARIATIYEGTTGIQANDLIGRKLRTDQGRAMQKLIAEVRRVVDDLGQDSGDSIKPIRQSLAEGAAALEDATEWLLNALGRSPEDAYAASVPYLMLAGYVCGGWQMARAALKAQEKLAAGEERGFYGARLVSARFYAEQVLPLAGALKKTVESGGGTVMTLTEEQF